MDRLIVERKLEALRSCVARLHAKRPATLEALRAGTPVQQDCQAAMTALLATFTSLQGGK